MPTTRPRHEITETEQIVRALEGHRAVVSQLERDASARRDAVARTSGVLTAAYGGGYLADLREDWPE